MKIIIALFFLFFSISVKAQKKNQKPIKGVLTLTVSHIQRDEKEIYARRGNETWKANCPTIPDSLKVGSKISASRISKIDSCKCIFKRVV